MGAGTAPWSIARVSIAPFHGMEHRAVPGRPRLLDAPAKSSARQLQRGNSCLQPGGGSGWGNDWKTRIEPTMRMYCLT